MLLWYPGLHGAIFFCCPQNAPPRVAARDAFAHPLLLLLALNIIAHVSLYLLPNNLLLAFKSVFHRLFAATNLTVFFFYQWFYLDDLNFRKLSMIVHSSTHVHLLLMFLFDLLLL